VLVTTTNIFQNENVRNQNSSVVAGEVVVKIVAELGIGGTCELLMNSRAILCSQHII